MPWFKRISLRHYSWVKNLRWKISSFRYPYTRIYKRTLHLFYRFRHEEYLRRVRWYFEDMDRASREENLVALFGTVRRDLHRLRCKMLSLAKSGAFVKDPRVFRSEFCQTVRTFRGLTRKNLCVLINAREEIATLDDKYPCLHGLYPFTPEFIEKFETRISGITEYVTTGSLGGGGFPTQEFALLVAKACNAEAEFEEFEQWYSGYTLAQLERSSEERADRSEKAENDFRQERKRSLSLVDLSKLGQEG